jgi:hypothetical protein
MVTSAAKALRSSLHPLLRPNKPKYARRPSFTIYPFTHIKDGKAQQVDGSNKPVASRRALAEGTIELKPETINLQSVFNSFIIENVLRLFKLDIGIKFDDLYSTKEGDDLVQ